MTQGASPSAGHGGDLTSESSAAFTLEPVNAANIAEARALVNRVFPLQTPGERLSWLLIRHRDARWMHALHRWLGVPRFLSFWLARDESGRPVGTTGLYRCARDRHEAVWLAWFCVAPEVRRRGIGGRLLDLSIAEARATGAQYLRLYTSDDPNEAAAQLLYEKRGLEVYRRKRGLLHTTLYRRKCLDAEE